MKPQPFSIEIPSLENALNLAVASAIPKLAALNLAVESVTFARDDDGLWRAAVFVEVIS